MLIHYYNNLGDGNVGKTSLLYVYAHGEFPEVRQYKFSNDIQTYVPTVFDNFFANLNKEGS